MTNYITLEKKREKESLKAIALTRDVNRRARKEARIKASQAVLENKLSFFISVLFRKTACVAFMKIWFSSVFTRIYVYSYRKEQPLQKTGDAVKQVNSD